MSALRKLVALKPQAKKTPEPTDREDYDQIRITYYQSGWAAALKAMGRSVVLRTCLENVYHSFKDQCRRQEEEQNRLKQPIREEQERQKSELRKKETAASIFEDDVKRNESLIESCKFEMVDVKRDPEKYGVDADKRPKAQFYIGLFLLLPITLYLFVFYISASYSAFFKDFETDSLTAAIFDANAFTKAINDGWLEAIFVGTIPFVFMGLGYLIHMFHKKKKNMDRLKLAALFITTFIFDVILAYLIEKKIFLFNAVLGQQFTPQDAVTSVNFWGIIFAGFVVYIIWGLVFDFVMKEYENIDKIKNFIRQKKQDIQNYRDQNLKLSEKIKELQHQIAHISGVIAELQSKIDGFIFPKKSYHQYHNQYVEGWMQAISAEIAVADKRTQEMLDASAAVSQAFLEEVNKNELDTEDIIYTRMFTN